VHPEPANRLNWQRHRKRRPFALLSGHVQFAVVAVDHDLETSVKDPVSFHSLSVLS